MKNKLLVIAFFIFGCSFAQVYEGKGDQKFQIGANFQNEATGINLTYDYGLGENISIGLSSSYALGIDDDFDADFGDRFDFKARFNANIGNVINIGNNLDIYPGLSLSFKNFGGHFGTRYFFTNGFGVYAEAAFPLAKYDEGESDYFYNQFTFNIGASFNL